MNDFILNEVDVITQGKHDDFFITSINYEDRSFGISKILSNNYKCQHGIILIFNDEKSDIVQNNLLDLRSLLESKCNSIHEILVTDNLSDLFVADFFSKITDTSDISVSVDITTIPTRYLFSLFKFLDDYGLWKKIRFLYTEPKEYNTELYLPMSIGMGIVNTVEQFIGYQSASLPLLLIEFLGYEGDRAKAIFDDIEPDETALVIPKPAYYSSWEGRTEKMNNILCKIIEKSNHYFASSFDPKNTVDCLLNIEKKFPSNKFKWIIIPLGTKPQSLGIYLMWRTNPNTFSILHANPLKENPSYSSKGIGRKRLLYQNSE